MTSQGSGVAPAARRRTKKDHIVEAAATVIAAQGVRRLKVEDVAREAGTSTALLYYHFADRSGLIRAALEHANQQAPSMLDADEVDREQNARTWLVQALLAELDDAPAVRNNSVVWNEVSTSATFDPALREALQSVTDSWNAKVARTVVAGQADGSIDPTADADELAEQLTCLVEGLSLRWLAGTLELQRARTLLAGSLAVLLPA